MALIRIANKEDMISQFASVKSSKYFAVYSKREYSLWLVPNVSSKNVHYFQLQYPLIDKDIEDLKKFFVGRGFNFFEGDVFFRE